MLRGSRESENMVLRKMSEFTRDEATGHRSFIMCIVYQRLQGDEKRRNSAGQCRIAYKILVGKPEAERPL